MGELFSAVNINAIIHQILSKNPTVRNGALAGVLEAQIKNFRGSIQISDKRMRVDKEKIAAKKIKISPYGYWKNIFITIKRFLTGVNFKSEPKLTLSPCLKQGRRVIIYCPLIETVKERIIYEKSQKSILTRIREFFQYKKQTQ